MSSLLHTLADRFSGREYHDGTVLANRLGLQVARTLLMNRRITRAIREQPPSPLREALLRDGVAVVPDYLPADVFAQVRAEYDTARARGLLSPSPPEEDNQVVEERVSIAKNRDVFPVTWRELGEKPDLRDLVGSVIGQTPRSSSLIISVMRLSPEPVRPTRMIGANYIHADIHFPSLKAWLYLDDIDESNGAMTFAPGSHRVTLGRLAYEYEASVRIAAFKQHSGLHEAVPYAKLRMPSAGQLKRMGVVERPLCGKANTLIVGNVMGFHRRGDFQPGTTREMLMIRFGDRGGKSAMA